MDYLLSSSSDMLHSDIDNILDTNSIDIPMYAIFKVRYSGITIDPVINPICKRNYSVVYPTEVSTPT